MESQIKPSDYQISVQYECVEGDWCFVARVAELPDLEDYSHDPVRAKELILDSIFSSYQLCQEKGIKFPRPFSEVNHA